MSEHLVVCGDMWWCVRKYNLTLSNVSTLVAMTVTSADVRLSNV